MCVCVCSLSWSTHKGKRESEEKRWTFFCGPPPSFIFSSPLSHTLRPRLEHVSTTPTCTHSRRCPRRGGFLFAEEGCRGRGAQGANEGASVVASTRRKSGPKRSDAQGRGAATGGFLPNAERWGRCGRSGRRERGGKRSTAADKQTMNDDGNDCLIRRCLVLNLSFSLSPLIHFVPGCFV